VAYDPVTGLISDLKQHTKGTAYPQNDNPIQMNAGAHYSNNGRYILYTSTRTPLGNSQLFKIPADSKNVLTHPQNQLTFHLANDYVPDQMEDGRIVLTSDMVRISAILPIQKGSAKTWIW
jgi:hypothetical protein